MDLLQLRSKIDAIDNEIVDLFIKRRAVMNDIVEYKKKNDLPIYDKQRENSVIEKMFERCGGGFFGGGIKLIYSILIDLNKLHGYEIAPKEMHIPTNAGGASIRAILTDVPGAFNRYIAPLAAANINIVCIRTQPMPGGKTAVDIEISGNYDKKEFDAVLAVLADTAESFVLL